METSNQSAAAKKVRLKDFICLRCHSEATNTKDRLCQLCKALGESAEKDEPPFGFQELFGLQQAKQENQTLV